MPSSEPLIIIFKNIITFAAYVTGRLNVAFTHKIKKLNNKLLLSKTQQNHVILVPITVYTVYSLEFHDFMQFKYSHDCIMILFK
jgi:hypothetical protein